VSRSGQAPVRRPRPAPPAMSRPGSESRILPLVVYAGRQCTVVAVQGIILLLALAAIVAAVALLSSR
jgi:hypothetical protein